MATLPNLAWNHSSVLRSSPCVIIPGGYKENNVVFEPVISFHRFFHKFPLAAVRLKKKRKQKAATLSAMQDSVGSGADYGKRQQENTLHHLLTLTLVFILLCICMFLCVCTHCVRKASVCVCACMCRCFCLAQLFLLPLRLRSLLLFKPHLLLSASLPLSASPSLSLAGSFWQA